MEKILIAEDDGSIRQERIDGLERLLAGLPEKYLLGRCCQSPKTV